MKILFVAPEILGKAETYTKKDGKSIGFVSLTDAVLAALTPDFAEFTAIDEVIEPLETDEMFDAVDADVVAISVNMTYKANRAIEIARKFKERGKIIIWGGVHVTSLYDHHRERFEKEIALYADIIVLGEAEEIWPQVVRDIYIHDFKKIYRADNRPKSDIWPTPKFRIQEKKRYLVDRSCMATKGCPMNCDFCSVTSFNGEEFRKRNAKMVANDIREILSRQKSGFGHGFVAFVDDNIGFHRGYFVELLLELVRIKKEYPKFCWGGQANLHLIEKTGSHKGKEYNLGKLMKESGCIAMFVGVESVSKESLALANKNFNDVDKYPDQIKKWHDFGIMLNFGMVIFERDTEKVFEDIYEFLVKYKIEISLLNILTPLPGTELYKRFIKEGRIFDHNWENYDGRHVVFYPEFMTPEQLERGYFDLWKALYSWPSIIKRVVNPSQVFAAVRSLPNLSKSIQIISRTIMNNRYKVISDRIGKARQTMPRERFGKNCTFKELRGK